MRAWVGRHPLLVLGVLAAVNFSVLVGLARLWQQGLAS
jgi:hypothetical protein